MPATENYGSLSRICSDLWNEIFCHLSPETMVLCVRLVCREWRRIVDTKQSRSGLKHRALLKYHQTQFGESVLSRIVLPEQLVGRLTVKGMRQYVDCVPFLRQRPEIKDISTCIFIGAPEPTFWIKAFTGAIRASKASKQLQEFISEMTPIFREMRAEPPLFAVDPEAIIQVMKSLVDELPDYVWAVQCNPEIPTFGYVYHVTKTKRTKDPMPDCSSRRTLVFEDDCLSVLAFTSVSEFVSCEQQWTQTLCRTPDPRLVLAEEEEDTLQMKRPPDNQHECPLMATVKCARDFANIDSGKQNDILKHYKVPFVEAWVYQFIWSKVRHKS